MKQKTFFKVIILILIAVIIYILFNNDSSNANIDIPGQNIDTSELAFKYDPNDDRLESLKDVYYNGETNLVGRVLVVNPNPIVDEVLYNELFENTIFFYDKNDMQILTLNLCFDGNNVGDKVNISLNNNNYDLCFDLLIYHDVLDNPKYVCLPYVVIPVSPDSYDGLDLDISCSDILLDRLDEFVLISKEPIFKEIK